jgi:hypothetical protein
VNDGVRFNCCIVCFCGIVFFCGPSSVLIVVLFALVVCSFIWSSVNLLIIWIELAL